MIKHTTETVRKYVQGQLHGDELDEFELQFFSDSQLREEVELEMAMQQGLAEEHSRSTSPTTNAEVPSHQLTFVEWLKISWWSIGAAAALVLVAVAFLNIPVTPQGAQPLLAASPVITLRGGSEVQRTLKLPLDANGLVLISVDVSGMKLPLVVTITRAKDGETMSTSFSQMDETGLVQMLVPESFLQAGHYLLANNRTESSDRKSELLVVR